MYHLTDGNAGERIEDWDTLIATIESWEGHHDASDVDEGDVDGLNKAIGYLGYRVEEVA